LDSAIIFSLKTLKNLNYKSHIAHVNEIDLHFIEFGNNGFPLLMMHGLTANAHAFNGLIKAGLSKNHHVFSVDFRGRGLSQKTSFDYSIKSHANDIIAMLDYIDIETIDVCGHSFGGLMASYLAHYYPTRIRKIVILDAAPKMNPKAAEMLGPALSRLSLKFNSFDEYIAKVKQAPYINFWDDTMLSYYRADVRPNHLGTYETWSSMGDIVQIAVNTSIEPWKNYFEVIPHQTLLINATENYTLNQQLLTVEQAKLTVDSMKQANYFASKGNHQTMLYGEHAESNVKAIVNFLK
jgi:pimeloyl-ACP methyl ester carboxylesterase